MLEMLILVSALKTGHVRVDHLAHNTHCSGRNTGHGSHTGHITQLLHRSALGNKADRGLSAAKHPCPEGWRGLCRGKKPLKKQQARQSRQSNVKLPPIPPPNLFMGFYNLTWFPLRTGKLTEWSEQTWGHRNSQPAGQPPVRATNAKGLHKAKSLINDHSVIRIF